MKKRWLPFFLLLALTATAFSQDNPVVIPGSQTRTFTSSLIKGQEYVLHISLPAGYVKGNRRYPVVYLLDSQWDFPPVNALHGEQYYDGFIPELILVGITWGGAHPNADSLRARDYTPTREERLPQSGGAGAFLSVIQNEVFPLVNKTFRTDTANQTLMGCSLGGLFTLYTLFTHPALFQRYIAASPAFQWNNNVLYRYEKEYAEHGTNPPARLFLCVGGVEESVAGFQQLTRTLSDRQYKNLQVESRVLDNIGHSGTKGEGYERGLQYVFRRPALQLPDSVLQRYAGTYKLTDGTAITLTVKDGSLYATAGSDTYRFFAASASDFYIISSFLNIHFTGDEKGGIKGFELNRYGNTGFANKIK